LKESTNEAEKNNEKDSPAKEKITSMVSGAIYSQNIVVTLVEIILFFVVVLLIVLIKGRFPNNRITKPVDEKTTEKENPINSNKE